MSDIPGLVMVLIVSSLVLVFEWKSTFQVKDGTQ